MKVYLRYSRKGGNDGENCIYCSDCTTPMEHTAYYEDYKKKIFQRHKPILGIRGVDMLCVNGPGRLYLARPCLAGV